MADSSHTQYRAVIGHQQNFWLFSSDTGFDLTRPSYPNKPNNARRLTLKTHLSHVTLSASKTALVIIDMQNFFLSPALGRAKAPGHAACQQLIDHAIPAAREAGIQIVWLNWGLTEKEIQEMPPAIKRTFGFQAVQIDEKQAHGKPEWLPGVDDAFAETSTGVPIDKMGNPQPQDQPEAVVSGKIPALYKGLGADCGTVKLPDGSSVAAGRLLMRHTWNAALHPPLDAIYEEGRKAAVPDVWIHKNRMVRKSSLNLVA